MAESPSAGIPMTVIDRLEGDSVQVGDNNKKHVISNCIFNIHHHHHHYHHHLACGCRCEDGDTPGTDQAVYTRDEEEVEMEVLQNVSELGEAVHRVIDQQFSDNARFRISSNGIPADSLKIIDTWGCELKIGDVVGLGSIFAYLFPMAIYAGDGMVVRCDEKTGLIVKEELNLRKTFYKRGVTYGSVPIYSRTERVRRAEGRVGDIFTEGHKKDFVCWCFTGVTNMKALRQFVFGQ